MGCPSTCRYMISPTMGPINARVYTRAVSLTIFATKVSIPDPLSVPRHIEHITHDGEAVWTWGKGTPSSASSPSHDRHEIEGNHKTDNHLYEGKQAWMSCVRGHA